MQKQTIKKDEPDSHRILLFPKGSVLNYSSYKIRIYKGN